MKGASIGLFSDMLPNEMCELISTFSISDYKRSYLNVGLVCKRALVSAKDKSQDLSPDKPLIELSKLLREYNKYTEDKCFLHLLRKHLFLKRKARKQSYKESEKHSTKKLVGMKRRKEQNKNAYTISLPYTLTGNRCRNR